MRRLGLALLAGASLVAACKGEDTRDKVQPQTGATTVASGAGGSGGGGGGAGGGDPSVSTGTGGAGAEGGAGPEDCYDGIDGDDDGFADCLDHEAECKPLCVDTGATCMGSKLLADPSLDVLGDNTEFGKLAGATCGTGQPGLEGHANVYRVKAASDGVLDASVTPVEMPDDMILTVRKACDDPKTELACGDGLGSECVRVPVKKGDELFLFVSGYSFLNYGPYHLSLATRPTKCGDTLLDPGETCDDGNANPGDGCSATCQLEISEVEDNGTPAKANPFKDPMVGAIATKSDVDVIAIDVTKPNSTLTATTVETPGKGCRKTFIDSYLELVAADGTTVLAKNDDGNGVTAKIVQTGLAVGKYYLRLSAAPGSPPNHSFNYRWSIKLTP